MRKFFVYFVIIAVLSVGIWFLLDINDRKKTERNIKIAKNIVAVDQRKEVIVSQNKSKSNINEQQKDPALQNKEETEIANSDKAPQKQALNLPTNNYYVQIGAFGDEPSANEIYNLLKNENIEATLLKPDEQFEIYRLVVGPYSTEKEAESKVEQLNEIGFPSFVVEAQ